MGLQRLSNGPATVLLFSSHVTSTGKIIAFSVVNYPESRHTLEESNVTNGSSSTDGAESDAETDRQPLNHT